MEELILDFIDEYGFVEIDPDEETEILDLLHAFMREKKQNFKRRELKNKLFELLPISESHLEEIPSDYSITELVLTDPDLIQRNKVQIEKLKLIPQPEQRSQEWYDTRNNMLTASSIASIFNLNPYATRTKYLMEKCGFIKGFSGSAATEWGVKYEPVANSVYAHIYKTDVYEFGLIPHPVYKFVGASPDGITSEGIMIEIKVPTSRDITGDPPIYYWIQMQIQMEVADLDLCHFTELRIKEYAKEEDFWSNMDEKDNYKTIDNKFHGCVLVFWDYELEKNKYIHAPFEFEHDQLLEWIKETIKETEQKDFMLLNKSFWYVEKISIVPVKRDKEWFNKNIKEIQDFYNEIQYFKKEGIEKFNEKYPSDVIKKQTNSGHGNAHFKVQKFEFLDD